MQAMNVIQLPVVVQEGGDCRNLDIWILLHPSSPRFSGGAFEFRHQVTHFDSNESGIRTDTTLCKSIFHT